jgi:hypothetical protein
MKLNADGAVTNTLIHGAVGVMCQDENGFSWLRIRRSQAPYLDATHDGAVPPRRHGQRRQGHADVAVNGRGGTHHWEGWLRSGRRHAVSVGFAWAGVVRLSGK